MEKAFVVLFPYGNKGLADPERKIKVKPHDYIEHCFYYRDKRFTSHPLFMFWA